MSSLVYKKSTPELTVLTARAMHTVSEVRSGRNNVGGPVAQSQHTRVKNSHAFALNVSFCLARDTSSVIPIDFYYTARPTSVDISQIHIQLALQTNELEVVRTTRTFLS